MNKDINSLYEQYKSLGNPETFDEFVQLKDQAGEDVFFEFMNNNELYFAIYDDLDFEFKQSILGIEVINHFNKV